jgi:hypothetical protein
VGFVTSVSISSATQRCTWPFPETFARIEVSAVQNQRDVLAEHAQKRFAFLALRNSIGYIRREDFVGADDALLASQLAKVTNAINIMEREVSACLRRPGACEFTSFDVSDFPLPKPKAPSGIWVTKAPMPTARARFGLVAARNGKIYALGGSEGQTAAGEHLTTVEEYDPTTNSWATKAPMPIGRLAPGLAAATNGKI